MADEHDQWYRDAFAEDYLRIYQHRDEAEARAAVTKLVTMLGLPAGARCLDLCCGNGRHLAVLLELGYDAWGLDLSEVLLNDARKSPESRHRVVQGDMRHLPFQREFAAVFSFFSSFGYFLDDAENARVLAEIARVLLPDGQFMIDFLNPAHIRRTLVPESNDEIDGLRVHQRRWIDETRNTVEKQITVRDGDGERQYHERIKLYEADDFRRMAAAAGLHVARVLGDLAGTALTPQAKRMIIIGGRHGD